MTISNPAAPFAGCLHAGFLRSMQRHGHRPALEVGGRKWSYEELHASAAALAATLQRHSSTAGEALTAVFAHKSATAFAGTLAALLAGRGYVPLNRSLPAARTRAMLEASGCLSVIVDASSEPQIDEILGQSSRPLLVILPERQDTRELSARWPSHTILGTPDLAPAASWTLMPSAPEAVAYLLFTSGSTGAPKGVMVTHSNGSHFVASVVERYGVTEIDRFSQMFDATFDLSVFDMFAAWSAGACVCCPSEHDLLNPDRFLRETQPTIWLSVPSVGVFMKRFGALKPGRFPSLRWSLFCGEALPVEIARAWAAAAPQSAVENLYGPTEVTVACLAYRWSSGRSPAESELGIVPIGEPLPGMTALVVDDTLAEVEPGAVGELLLAGPQVTPGYWRDADATARAYVRVPHSQVRFYRTGDRVRRPVGSAPLLFVGRLDDQIKVLGHRLELGEVEARLREAPRVDGAAAVAWPLNSGGVGGVVAFVTGADVDVEEVRSHLRRVLPAYAVPRAIHVRPSLPLNSNGKVDRGALAAWLKDDQIAADEIRRVILSIVERSLPSGQVASDVPDELDLLADGIIDSLGFVELIAEVEEQMAIAVDLEDLDPDKLAVVGPLSRHIARTARPQRS